MRRPVPYLAIVFTCIMSGCGYGEEELDAPFESEVLYFEQIGYGQRGSLTDSTELAIWSPADWAVYRDSLVPAAPFDSVDFEQGIVLLVALPQNTSGHSIAVTSIEAFDTVAVATYLVSVPGGDCLTASAEAVPFTAVMVRRTELPVRFDRETEEYRCTFGRRR